MDTRETLLQLTNLAWKELLESLEGITEPKAWAQAQFQPDEYLHTEGSILSIIAHVTGSKFMYGTIAFGGSDLRWRDVTAQMEARWPSLEAMREWLVESHATWLSTWQHETDFEREVRRFNGDTWPVWRLIATMIHHDHYHAGQIQVLRATLPPSATPPPSEGELWQKYCGDLPDW